MPAPRTRLPENVTWTDRDSPQAQFARVAAPACLIYDPDPSLLRAGLLDSFACHHNLNRLAEGVDYLTADVMVESPFLAAFLVREVCSLDLRALRRLIAKHEIGTLEIKVRGVQVTPEALRAKLKPRGTQTATLILVGGHRAATAILAHRVSSGGLARSSAGAEVATGSLSCASEASPLPTAPAGSCGADAPLAVPPA